MSKQPTYPHDIGKAYVWWIERDNIAIAYLDLGSAIYPANYDSSGFKYSSMTGRVYSPAEALTFRAHVVRKARRSGGTAGQVLETTAHSPEFPEEFHEALVNKVIQHGYEKTGDVNMLNVAKYWEGKYMLKVREGIANSAKGKVGGFKKVLGHF